MTDFLKGDSYKDYHTGLPKLPKTGFCGSCGVELSKDEHAYCVRCEHVYQEVQEEHGR